MNCYAHKTERRGAVLYLHVGPRRYVELHYMPHPIVPVTVRERVEGDTGHVYWGWRKPDGTYTMIWPSETQVEMCFPYGTEVEEKRGKGTKVRLTIEERAED